MTRNRILVNPQNPNGITVSFTEAEETQADTEAAEAIVRKQAEADEAEQKATDKASAKAKLIAGEALTEAEADTIVL